MILGTLLAASVVVCTPASLEARLHEIAAPAGPHVGAAVLVVETGQTATLNAERHFPMQSVYKVPIAIAVLRRVDRGRLRLEDEIPVGARDIAPVHSPIRERHPQGGVTMSIRELIRAMIVESDGTASDVLLRLTGANEATRALRALGVNGMVVRTSEKEMARDEGAQYRNWATPDAAVKLLRALLEGRGLEPASRDLLLGFMTETETGPRRIKGMLPVGTRVAHKTGSSGTRDGLTAATNDIGLVALPDGRHLAVAVFVSDSRADTDAREAVIARIARAAWDCSTSREGSTW